jgi:serine/threonine-protein kinase
MGFVYRAELMTLGKAVAIKILKPELASAEENVQRFIREARAASLLAHPNLVSVLDFGRTDGGAPYIAMEVCNGVPLNEILALGPLPTSRIAVLFDQVLAGLAEAHGSGVLHLDLKPENVIVDRWRDGSDFVRVIDFGIARITGETDEAEQVAGTPRYMAPELLRGEQPDPRTDLYALGVMLYECVAGASPFEGSVGALIDAHLTRQPPRPALEGRSAAANDLIDVAMCALEKDPNRRYADSEAMRDAIRQVRSEREYELTPSNTQRSSGPVAVRRLHTTPWGQARGTPSGPVPSPGGAVAPILGAPLAALLEALIPVRPGRRVLITATEGGGASRLLRRANARLQAESIRVARVDADPTGARRPLFPLLLALAELMGVRSASPAVIASFAEAEGWLAPTICEALRALGGEATRFDKLPLPVRRKEIEDRVVEAFRAIAQPAVVLLDSVTRFDRASLRVLSRLVVDREVRPALCLAGAPSLSPQSFDDVVAVPVLEESEVSRLLARVVPDTAAAKVLGDVQPTPLMVTQAAFSLMAGDDPRGQSLADLISRRAIKLGHAERETLAAAAVLGTAGTLDAVEEVSELGEGLALASALLTRAGFLMPGAGEGMYEFMHPLVRDAAYELVPIGKRRELHGRAHAFATSRKQPQQVVLYHAANALEPTFEQARFRAAAAQIMRKSLDVDGAVATLGEAYRVARQAALEHGDDEGGVALLDTAESLAETLLEARQPSVAEAVLREVEPQALAHRGREERRLDLLGQALAARGRRPEAAQILARSITMARRRRDSSGLSDRYVTAAELALATDGPPGALMALEEAIDAVSPGKGLSIDDKEPLPAPRLWRLGVAYANAARECGAMAAARFAARAARRLANREGDTYGEAMALVELGRVLARERMGREASDAFAEAAETANRLGDRVMRAEALRAQADVVAEWDAPRSEALRAQAALDD